MTMNMTLPAAKFTNVSPRCNTSSEFKRSLPAGIQQAEIGLSDIATGRCCRAITKEQEDGQSGNSSGGANHQRLRFAW